MTQEAPTQQDKERAESILADCTALESARAPFEGLWSECEEVCLPFAEHRSRSAHLNSSPDVGRAAANFDSTARNSLQTLTLGCSARITPNSGDWCALKPPAPIAHLPAAQGWYYRCGQILLRALAEEVSNFYALASLHYKHRGCYGTAATEVVAAPNGKGLVFRPYPVGSFAIAQNRFGRVDTLARRFTWSARDICEAFKDTAPKSVRDLAEKSETARTPVELIHLVRPRHQRDPRKTDARNKGFESLYLHPQEKVILSESGYDEFPVAVSRWELNDLSPYGIPPAAYALAETGQTNYLEQMLDTLAEVAAFPRVLYGGNLKGDVDFNAMGLTCWDASSGMADAAPREWLTSGRYDIGKDRLADKRKVIEDAFFVTLFNPISRLLNPDQATATAIRGLQTESLELFHPIFSNTTGEFLVPLLRRSWAILFRQGAFPPPPAAVFQEDLIGPIVGEPDVEFTGAMARALEANQLNKLNEVLTVLGPFLAADASILDHFDFDTITPALLRGRNLPADWIRSPEGFNAIRNARQMANQAAMAKEAATTVRDLGGAQGIQDLQRIAS